MNEITSTQAFSQSTEGASAQSRGIILSDVNGTLVSHRTEGAFYKRYAIWMAAMQHSGYETGFHSKDPTGNERILPKQFEIANIDLTLEQFEYDGAYVLSKESETAGMKVLVAVDDEPGSHSAKADHNLDINDPYTIREINRIADEFEASGRTQKFTFNPSAYKAPDLSPNPNGGVA